MAHSLEPAETYPSLPTVEDDIIQSVAQPLHDGNIAAAWDKLGNEQAPLVRQALIEADRIRNEGTDAGDALLQGIAITYSGLTGQISLERLRKEIESEDNIHKKTQPKARPLRRLLGIAALMTFGSRHRDKTA